MTPDQLERRLRPYQVDLIIGLIGSSVAAFDRSRRNGQINFVLFGRVFVVGVRFQAPFVEKYR
jgi:hypothetical protein